MENSTAVLVNLRRVTVWSLYLVALFIPLFYLPLTPDPLTGKQAIIGILVLISLTAWLVRILISKAANYKSGVANIFFGLIPAVILLASIFSDLPQKFLFVPDATGEHFFSFIIFILLAFIAANNLSRQNAKGIIFALFIGGMLSGIIFSLQLLQMPYLPDAFRYNPAANTLNGTALLFGAIFLMAIGFVTFRKTEESYSRLFTALIWLTAFVSALILILVDFKNGWIGIATTAVLFVAFTAGHNVFRRISGVIILLLLAVSVTFALLPISPKNYIPGVLSEIEAAPSFTSTIKIGLDTLKTHPVFGTGPATFAYGFNHFRPASFNQTIFWNAKFTHGFSFLSTAITTLGTVGVLTLLSFMVWLLHIIWRIMRRGENIDSATFGFAAAIIFGFALWFIYPPTFAMNALLFLAIGGLFAVSQPLPLSRIDASGPELETRELLLDTQTRAFSASLAATTIFIYALLSGYFLVQKYLAEMEFAYGIAALTTQGNLDAARRSFEKAIVLDPRNDRYIRQRAELDFAAARDAMNALLAGNANAQDSFQRNLNSALEGMRAATAINPREPGHWIALGTFYETVMPTINGADQFAVAAYQEALRQDPLNPVPATLLGRTHITLVDLMDLRVRQGLLQGRSIESGRQETLTRAKEYLEDAIQLKPDFANAQFLLAQAFIREGNVDDAISRGVNAALSAPQDVGIAFFLGFLFYQKDLLIDAEEQFSRAVNINPNYSNARYFLGLIYDKTNRRGEALKQFRKIEELNPENEEVARIISNLEAGRPALSAIVPPPQERREPPIQEQRRR